MFLCMRYIHQLPDWPRFRWDHAKLMPLLATARHQQGMLLGAMKTLGFSFSARANLENLAAEVVKSSAIEGTIFDPDAVRSSIARKLGMPCEKDMPTSRAVEGAVDVLLDATRNFEVPLTAERLLSWQAALFPTGRSGLQKILVGAWRTPEMDPMRVISGPISREHIRRKQIHFEAPPAERLSHEVAEFLRWFEATDEIDLVVRAGIAHFWFVTIHPFEDGNGRVSRAIADLALARAEGSALRFYSMSTQIEQEKRDYYDALEKAQKGSLDITGWLEWFLGCFERAVASALREVERVLRKSARWEKISQRVEPNERQRKVLNALLDAGEEEFSTSRYAKIAGVSLDTALRDIKELLRAEVVFVGSARGRSTNYRLGVC